MTTTTEGTPEQRLAAAVDLWLKTNDRSVAWLARRANLKRTTLRSQIHAGRFSLTSALAVAEAIGTPVEELAA